MGYFISSERLFRGLLYLAVCGTSLMTFTP